MVKKAAALQIKSSGLSAPSVKVETKRKTSSEEEHPLKRMGYTLVGTIEGFS